jgi:hypothetical protein
VVEVSSHVNHPVIVGDEDGTVHVPCFDWQSFLGNHFHKIPQLLSYHHFSVFSSHPGIIKLRKFQDSASEDFQLLKKSFGPSEFPALVMPNGLNN